MNRYYKDQYEIGDYVWDWGHKVYGEVYGFVASVTGERLALLRVTHDFSGRKLPTGKFDCIASYKSSKCGQEKESELRK